jgi:hypothetical protein
MSSRWSSIAVCVLWVIAMSWLVSEKVLPPLLLGDPPSYRTIADSRNYREPVGWKMFINGRQIGSALSTAQKLPGDQTEVKSRVIFDRLPVDELAPSWLRGMLGPLLVPQAGNLKMESESTLTVDAEGRLAKFHSALHVQSMRNVVRLYGAFEGGRLKLTIHSGDFSYTTEVFLPPKSLAGDALSPQACLPGLRKGQTWTAPSYSPLRPPNDPMEILKAAVEDEELIVWNGRREPAWLVVYRADPGLSFGADKAARGRLWVRPDGTVLRQQTMLLGCTLTFVRLSGDEAAALEKKLRNR